MYEKFGQFIDGKWQKSSNNETYKVINPATEEVLGDASKATSLDVDNALKSAEKGLQTWKKNTRLFAPKIRKHFEINVWCNYLPRTSYANCTSLIRFHCR